MAVPQDTLADIRRDFERVPADLVKEAAKFPAAILADVQGRRGTMNSRVAAIGDGMAFAGPAFTVEVRGGDNLLLHAALNLAKPGDVIVCDGKDDMSCALMGALMMNHAKVAGLAAVVIDGAIRDVAELRELGFPVYASGANPNGPTKATPGRIGWPVSCGGATVHPGDLVVGDDDGIVVIERARVASLLPLAAKKVADEDARMADIRAKKNLRQGWLEPALRAAGMLKDGESL